MLDCLERNSGRRRRVSRWTHPRWLDKRQKKHTQHVGLWGIVITSHNLFLFYNSHVAGIFVVFHIVIFDVILLLMF